MNILRILNIATLGNPSRTRKMILLTILEYAFRGAPYGILILAIWEFFLPLQHPGTELDVGRMMVLILALGVSLVLLFFVTRASFLSTYLDSYDIGADGRIAMAEHIRRLPMGFFNSRDPGDITAYLLNDYSNIEFMLSHLVSQLVGSICLSGVIVLALLFVDWRMALAAAAVIPLAIPAASVSGRIITHFGKKHQKTKVAVGSRMIEYLAGIKVVKAFNLQGVRFRRMKSSFEQLRSESIKLEAVAGPTIILAAFILHAGLPLVMLLGLHRLLGGALTIPVYIAFIILATRIYEPLISAVMMLGEMHYFQLGARRIEDLRSMSPLEEPAAPAEIPSFDIELRHVSFRYNEVDVLQDVSFAIPERSFTALVGPSGSGKTTITRLVARFWEVDAGSILIGGKDLRDIGTERLVEGVSMVFQDVYLFKDTIINNIRVGRRDADLDEVMEAAMKARCHEFIASLPDGYDTMVGEGGSTLSAGEKQRISIARAILKNAPIVMLDEATASLDPENAMHVQDAIQRLTREKTVLVIAHQLNTIMRADQIVVLNNGKVEELGRHGDLLQAGGLYARMWEEQKRARGWKLGGRAWAPAEEGV